MSDSESQASRKRAKRELSPFNDEVEPPCFSLASLGLQRVGTIPPPRPPKQPQPVQTLNARGMPARIRKKNPLFFDENIINDDRPLRMSLSPRKTPHKIVATSTPTKTPTKVLKKRKGVISRYMKSEEKIIIKKSSGEPRTPSKSQPSSGASSAASTPKSLNRQALLNATSTPKGISRLLKSHSNGSSIPKKELKENEDDLVTKLVTVAEDKRVGHAIGVKLRNLLKLPRAHKWVIYEWFCSFIDKPLLEGDNEFQTAIVELFPHLRTRSLKRSDWSKIRQLMGKPRRCSQAFFSEERKDLERKRQKLRFLQTRKSGEVRNLNYIRDLPDKIPLQLPIGTKVTARLRKPQDGIFTGIVEAFDSLTSTYRVNFDRPGMGTYTIQDFEIVSENFHEKLPLQSITKDFRPSLMSMLHSPPRGGGGGGGSCHCKHLNSQHNIKTLLTMNRSDPLLGQEIIESPFKNPVIDQENINGFPSQLLETMVRLKRVMKVKKIKLQRLSNMNNEAEVKCSQHMDTESLPNNPVNNANDENNSQKDYNEISSSPQLTEEFQRRYASIVISMERMNQDMQDYIYEVQAFTDEISREPQVQAMLTPSYMREQCRETAEEAVNRTNQGLIKNKKLLNLIRKLSTLLLVASHLGNEDSTEVNKILDGCIEEVRSSLHKSNIETFQKNVQLHLHHIRLGVGQALKNSSSVSEK